MAMHSAVVHVASRQESPVVPREIDVYVNIHPWSHWCPSVVPTTTSPSDPSGRPFVAGYPSPPVIVVPVPPSVVERGPSPRVIRHPHVAMVGHHPVTIRGVGMKIPSHAWDPNSAVRTVVDPPPVRPQLVVENVETDATMVVVLFFVVTVVVVALRVSIITSGAA